MCRSRWMSLPPDLLRRRMPALTTTTFLLRWNQAPIITVEGFGNNREDNYEPQFAKPLQP